MGKSTNQNIFYHPKSVRFITPDWRTVANVKLILEVSCHLTAINPTGQRTMTNL